MRKLLWILLLVLSACATTGRSSGDRYWIKSEDVYVGMDDAVSLLHYANYVRSLPAAERERETDRVRSAFHRDKSDFRRLQYAFALASADSSASERKQAQQLIEPMLEGRHESGMGALAALLGAHLNALTQAQQQGGQQAQKRIEELEKKLDAVKDIERSLLRREKGKL